MAFQAPNARQQELQAKKILEDIQMKKQLLLKQGAANLNLSSTTNYGQTEALLAQQRAHLQNAHSQSFGFFIAQDSLFGNNILPVLPRYDNNVK